jgi:hypothetical protein
MTAKVGEPSGKLVFQEKFQQNPGFLIDGILKFKNNKFKFY